MISDLQGFGAYWPRVYARTLAVAQVVPGSSKLLLLL